MSGNDVTDRIVGYVVGVKTCCCVGVVLIKLTVARMFAFPGGIRRLDSKVKSEGGPELGIGQ